MHGICKVIIPCLCIILIGVLYMNASHPAIMDASDCFKDKDMLFNCYVNVKDKESIQSNGSDTISNIDSRHNSGSNNNSVSSKKKKPKSILNYDWKSRIYNYLHSNDVKVRIDEEELNRIERLSAGVRVKVVKDIDPSTNRTVEFYEDDFLDKREMKKRVDKWKVIDIEDEDINEYLLDEEIKSSMRDSQGKNAGGNEFCSFRNRCCISSTVEGYEITSNHLKEDAHRAARLWTWFVAPNNRELFSFVDSLDFVIDLFEKKNLKNREEAHIAFVGDSLMDQFHSAMICSLQRTLGARLVQRKMKWIKYQKNLRIRSRLNNIFYVPLLEDQSIIELNSTAKGRGMRRIKLTYIRQYRPYLDDVTNKYTDATMKVICGIPFSATTPDGKDVVNVNVTNNNVDMILLNYGAHFEDPPELKEELPHALETLKICKQRGIHVAFRETFAQHFRFSYNGDYNRRTYSHTDLKDIPGSTVSFDNKAYCSPIVYKDKKDINWRYQLVKKYFSVLDLNENLVCKPKDYDENNLIDYIPAYAVTDQYWHSHLKSDCTHYHYSPGLFLSIEDGLYKSLLRSTLKPGECKMLPDNSRSPFIRGPKGLKQGISDGHDKSFLPKMFDLNPVNSEGATFDSSKEFPNAFGLLMEPILN